MKTKSPEFMSQCRVLNFPWMNKRMRRSKSEYKTVSGQAEYSQVLMFQPPSVEVESGVNKSPFPVIQMMDGKEPFIWEDGQTKFSDIPKEMTQTKSSCSRTSVKSVSKNRIPRPKNAFILYRSHVSQLLKETMTFKVRESNISSLVSEMWKKESDVVHAYYARRAALEWVKYMKRVQQQRCSLNTDESEIRSPTPPVPLRNEPSFSPEPCPNIVSYTQPSFSSPTQTSVQENSVVTSYDDPFIGTMLYNSSPDTSNLGFVNTDPSVRLSSSPQSSNGDILDPTYKDNIPTGNSGYLFLDKSCVPLSFKDFLFSYNMNQLDTNCAYTFNSSTPVFPTNTYPCMIDTGLGMDTNIRWPGLMQTSTPWPVNIV
ncbi:hypothetical protein PNEG_02277 [Pneumocystis murina B123]|uniref:HMG box domain-containing protein n=1 Tax=Pneumocystis murina (strain B123) TaxID=1069680 RepID=M7P647_PNEMU|nr:hypothetical protein PNEG_02277 [Pneumocystis murina B123]EMR09320.1 hypothetical protein PNEG_02277 [Pneumocystis murina B123]